ncbi:polysaccharide pyruvyl transferase family protein [Stakelama tenebrarum]|uniref:Polysaccharide pyruvyl transferase domain-containing protein n=1 Tax=Stakelama tenebrarum TaxID=2711215 RepID=A0A6G6Y3N7_9SPHN|nr:polysaccharide pyruvyl transferase family protein [Sphingosinithalassobacter tenebrarum]QIG79542.1 hypothetical protein G5C33_06895 [Sphingosinithalassobacter tenebrarum]
MTTLKVLHIASHEINVGDGALNAAIQASVAAQHGGPVDFTLEDVAVFRRELSAEDVAPYDLVIVGGGGGISNGPFAARTGTPMPMGLKEYRSAKTPFAFTALGHNIFAGERLVHAEALAKLLATVREKGDQFAVRNDGSLARMQRDLGEAAAGIVEIPDPGFFVAADAERPPEASARPYALIQVAGDSINRRMPVSRVSRLVGRLRASEPVTPLNAAIADLAMHLWRQHGLDILLAPHIPHDVPICAAIMRMLYARAGKAALHRPFRVGGTPHPVHARRFFAGYANAELIVGMRGHAVICGVGLGRPTIALSSHPKVVGFMEACDLADWSVPLDAQSGPALIARSDALIGNAQPYFDRRNPATADFRRRFDDFIGAAVTRAKMCGAA